MPYPPKKRQSQESYMSGCVRGLKAEGKSPAKAAQICSAVWSTNKSSKKRKKKRSK